MTDNVHVCSVCGDRLPPGGLAGLCPKCLLQAGLEDSGEHLHIRCPHCRHAIEIVDDTPLTEITCPSCDSRFSLIGNQTTTHVDGRPAKIGRFEILERVGVGAFGSVWKAHDPELDRLVAVKLPRKEQLAPDEAEQFLREARSAAGLRHPRIVAVHEVGREGDRLYIVSDFIKGVTLADWLTGQRPTFREAAEWCAEVAEALEHAHEMGVVHRDLKPSNIMLDDQLRPHITDFGLAKRHAAEITMTMEGRMLGTPAYMSPEQARGEGHQADGRADVYSLGVILFELLTGEKPFRGNTRMLLHQVMHDEPPGPRRLNAQIPRDLETVCLKCLEKDPRRRYATARQLVDELRRFLSGKPVAARPVGRAARVWRWSRRNPALASLTSALLLMMIAITAAAIGVSIHQHAVANIQRRLKADAELSEQNASEARQLEQEERLKAQGLAEEVRRRLSKSHVANGVREWGDHEPFRALLWFCAALELDAGGPRERIQRIRIAALLRQTPKLLRYGSVGATILDLSADGRRVAVLAGPHDVQVWTVEDRQPAGPRLIHDSSVSRATFNPDGSMLAVATRGATASDPAQVRLWSVAGGAAILAWEPGTAVRHIAFSADGKRLIAASDDHTARVWNTSTGEPASPVLEHDSTVHHASLSPDGRRAATGSWHKAWLWDVDTGQLLAAPWELDEAWVSAWFDTDGNRLLTSSGTTVQLWDVASGRALTPPMMHEDGVGHAEFSPDGKWLVTACGENTIGRSAGYAQVWDASTGEPVAPPLEHASEVRHATFSPDGFSVVTSSADDTARVWRATTGEPLTPSLCPGGAVDRAVFTPDGRQILIAGQQGQLATWDVAPRGAARLAPEGVPSYVRFRPDGRQTAVAVNSARNEAPIWGELRLLDGNGQLIGARRFTSPITHLEYDRQSRRLLTILADGTVELSDAASRNVIHSFSAPGLAGASFDSPAGRVVLIGGKRAQVWDPAIGTAMTPPLVHDFDVDYALFNADGSRLVTGFVLRDDDRPYGSAVRLWNAATGEPLAPAMTHTGWMAHAAFSPDGRLLVVPNGQEARLLEAASGRSVGEPLEHGGELKHVEFSPDGALVLTAGWNNSARLWNAATGKPVGVPMRHDHIVEHATISPDGRRVVTASRDKTARLWDAATGKPLSPPLRHSDWVQHGSFSPDGRLVVTVAARATEAAAAHVWDAASGESVATFSLGTWLTEASFSPDSGRIVVGNRFSRPQVWNLLPDDRPAANLVRLATFLSGARLDDTGAYTRLDAKALLALWDALPSE